MITKLMQGFTFKSGDWQI